MTRLTPIMLAAVAFAQPCAAAAMADGNTRRAVEMTLTDSGVSPAEVRATRGEHLRLAITRKTDSTCVRQLAVNGIDRPLPLDEMVVVEIIPTTSGKVRIRCEQGTSSATIDVE